MTWRVEFSNTIDASWLRLEPVRVGHIPNGQGTPACYVTLAWNDEPRLRIDEYGCGEECFAFQDAIVWREHLILGLGSHVHAISIADRSVTTVELDSYFASLHPTPDFLLVASGEELFRMEPDGSILWQSEPLGVDGVVVHEIGPDFVRGESTWDPPEDWRTFAIRVADGKRV